MVSLATVCIYEALTVCQALADHGHSVLPGRCSGRRHVTEENEGRGCGGGAACAGITHHGALITECPQSLSGWNPLCPSVSSLSLSFPYSLCILLSCLVFWFSRPQCPVLPPPPTPPTQCHTWKRVSLSPLHPSGVCPGKSEALLVETAECLGSTSHNGQC